MANPPAPQFIVCAAEDLLKNFTPAFSFVTTAGKTQASQQASGDKNELVNDVNAVINDGTTDT